MKKAEMEKLENISSLEIGNNMILQTINQQENDLKNRITTMAQNSIEKLRSKYADIKTELEEDKDVLQTKMKDLASSEQLLCIGTEDEIYLKIKSAKRAIKHSKALLSDLSKQRKHIGLSFYPNIILNADQDSFGSIFEEEKIQEKEGKEYIATFIERHKVKDKNVTLSFACILDSRTLMLYDNSNYCLMRLDMGNFNVTETLNMGSSTTFLTLFSERNWYYICRTGSQELAVACGADKRVQFISVQTTMTFSNSFCIDCTSNSIDFDEISGNIFVCNDENKVIVYEKTKKLIKIYQKDELGSSLFSSPRNIAFSNDKSTIYVTNWEKGLLALSRSGELRWLYTDPEVSGMRGICVLPGDSILVCGVHSHNIIQVDKHGKKIGTLIGTKDKLNEPRAIVYDSRTSRLIIGQNSDQILVYSLAQSHVL